MPEETAPKVEEVEKKSIRLVWGTTDNLATVYANQLVITHAGPEFYLVFGEVFPPLFRERGLTSETLPEAVEIKPLVRIALTPEAMLVIADAINNNIEKFMQKIKLAEEEQP